MPLATESCPERSVVAAESFHGVGPGGRCHGRLDASNGSCGSATALPPPTAGAATAYAPCYAARVIVVVGLAALRTTPAGVGEAVGAAPGIAAAAAADGATVEIVTKVGEDGAGEELLLALGRARIGHLAALRDPTRPTSLAKAEAEAPEEDLDVISILLAGGESAMDDESAEPPPGTASESSPAMNLEPADIALGLQYLREYRVLVAVEPLGEAGAAVVAEAAAFAGAMLVVVAQPAVAVPLAYAAGTLLEAPVDDRDGAFAGLVGRYAAALDRGIAPAEAFRAATSAGGWEAASG